MLEKELLRIKTEIESKTTPSLVENKMLEFIGVENNFEIKAIQKVINAYDENDLESIKGKYGIILKPEGGLLCAQCGRTLTKGFICNELNCRHKIQESVC